MRLQDAVVGLRRARGLPDALARGGQRQQRAIGHRGERHVGLLQGRLGLAVALGVGERGSQRHPGQPGGGRAGMGAGHLLQRLLAPRGVALGHGGPQRLFRRTLRRGLDPEVGACRSRGEEQQGGKEGRSHEGGPGGGHGPARATSGRGR
jgi:hypothetical protein